MNGLAERQAVAAAPRFAPEMARAAERVAGTVSARHTALSGSDAAKALESAWTRRFGSPPSRETLAVLTAQWAHETGRGEKMYNFNFGGIKGEGPSGLSVRQKTREGYGETERVITDRFRAYQTPEEGAGDYLALLSKRFPGAVDCARNGDANGFVHQLKSRGYFTGNESAYVRSVEQLSELAKQRGFDALGAGATTAPHRLDLPVQAAHVALPSAALDPDDIEELPFVSAEAIADELGRTALRILVDDETKRTPGSCP